MNFSTKKDIARYHSIRPLPGLHHGIRNIQILVPLCVVIMHEKGGFNKTENDRFIQIGSLYEFGS